MAFLIQPLISVVSFLILRLSRTASADCYFPDGRTKATNDTPCLRTGPSTCCGKGYACLSNNMCKLTEWTPGHTSTSITYARGSCTDSSWIDNACLLYCHGTVGDYDKGNNIVDCGADFPGRYYCPDAIPYQMGLFEACRNKSMYFEDSAPYSTLTVIGIDSSLYATSSTTSSSSTSSATQQTLYTQTPSMQPPLLSTPDHSSKSTVSSLALALGLGLPLALLVAGILVYLCVRRRRKRNASGDHMMDEKTAPPAYIQPGRVGVEVMELSSAELHELPEART